MEYLVTVKSKYYQWYENPDTFLFSNKKNYYKFVVQFLTFIVS